MRFVNISRAVFSGTRRFSIPKSASTVMSWSVTSTVPLIGVLIIPIFAERANVNTDPAHEAAESAAQAAAEAAHDATVTTPAT